MCDASLKIGGKGVYQIPMGRTLQSLVHDWMVIKTKTSEIIPIFSWKYNDSY